MPSVDRYRQSLGVGRMQVWAALRTECFLFWAETGLVPGHLLPFPAAGGPRSQEPWLGCEQLQLNRGCVQDVGASRT
jgi:hypothetical protein